LRLVSDDDELHVRLGRGLVQELDQPIIGSLANVDDRSLPVGIATQFQREPCLANTRGTLDVQMVHGPRLQVEFPAPSLNVLPHRRCRLPGSLVLIAPQPILKEHQPPRAASPAGCYGRMLITPARELVAPEHIDGLGGQATGLSFSSQYLDACI
jgi:hypothetical protein